MEISKLINRVAQAFRSRSQGGHAGGLEPVRHLDGHDKKGGRGLSARPCSRRVFKRKIIVLLQGYGNHSNRIIQATHYDAFCREHRHFFYNPSFFDIARLYYTTSAPAIDRCFVWIAWKLVRLGMIRVLDFKLGSDNSRLYALIAKRSISFVKGWGFRCEDLVKKHRDYIVRKYSLKESLVRQSRDYYRVHSAIDNYTMKIGIHIRRRDFREYKGGRYFFDDEVYMKAIADLQIQFSKKDVVFVIFSDEEVTLERRDNLVISNSQWYIDQKIMTEMDLLVGPPSTFTSWASFLGKVTRFVILNGTISPNWVPWESAGIIDLEG
jgi:hypothetical protein